MDLKKYNQKRDFDKTKEPKGIKRTSKGELRFVVQKHAASHLHYDFRLEIDGVLVSWAVPKGLSANPSDKRLAMHVEDHPMDYIDFEGTIPKGEYGGGTVMVWDFGTYHAEGNSDVAKDNVLMKKQHKDGAIKIVLKGKKLKGSWALVEMKGKENMWLLIKHKDEFSGTDIQYNPYSILTKRDFDAIAKGDNVWSSTRKPGEAISESVKENKKTATSKAVKDKEEFSADDLAQAKRTKTFPHGLKPQLATLAEEAFNNDDWLFETKYDGYRAIAEIKNGNCELYSRNGISFTKKYAEIAAYLSQTNPDMVLDGEIVIEDSSGKSQFQWLQNHDENLKRGSLKFYVFDILYFGNYDLQPLDLLQRKKILKAILPKHKNIIFSKHTIGKGIKAFATAEKSGGEGIIAKKMTSKYHASNRSKDWLKIKTGKQQEMVIGGFTEPQGSRKGLGALLCGYYKGDDFIYSGKVGSGFTEQILKDLRQKLEKIQRKTAAFSNPPKEPNAHWVSPKLVANIKFSEFTQTHAMRHPVYQGLRPDKKPKEVVLELPVIGAEGVDESRTSDSSEKKTKKTAAENTPKSSGKLTFSNLDKIYWPKEKITKGDVITYYDAIASYILPYLKDRPQSLRRTPNGIKDEGFFQKNVDGLVPKWVKTRQIKSESKEAPIRYLLCQDKDTLLYMANLGCIEINPWSSRVGSLNNPDYIIFDLDPKGAPIKNIVATALKLKQLLDKIKVPGFIKTSGGNGLHVFIPLQPKYTYEQTRNFSELISQMVHRELPEITSLERMPSKRKGKVYLDFLQNGKGKTMASIYSLRPREGAGVSTPLEWNEINDSLNLKDYNLFTIPKRLQEKGDLWQDIFSQAIDLKNVLKSL